MIDKISFTFGVLCICGSEWLALRKPDWFPLYYYAFMSVLLVWRFITYSRDKYQLFMLGTIIYSSYLTRLLFHRFLLFCEPFCGIADCFLPKKSQLVQGHYQNHVIPAIYQYVPARLITSSAWVLSCLPLLSGRTVW